MAKLVRVGDVPDTVRVNFVVKTAKFPELANWLHGLPYGEMSEVVRLALTREMQRTTGAAAANDGATPPTRGSADAPVARPLTPAPILAPVPPPAAAQVQPQPAQENADTSSAPPKAATAVYHTTDEDRPLSAASMSTISDLGDRF